MKQVVLKQGKVEVIDVPAPDVGVGEVLVKVRYSCISPGTEGSIIKASGTPLWKKVLQKPEQLKKAFALASRQGVMNAAQFVCSKIDAYSPLGYSAAGEVVAIGTGIDDIKLGDRVSCAGAQCAYHAEYIAVPRNLIALIPDELSYQNASVATLGAIALQGVRRFNPTLGETVVVIGLGLLGQLAVQILKANGCYVAGIDPDKKRMALAEKLGMDFCIDEENIDSAEQHIARLTDGYGADGVIITASSSSDEIISKAFKMCRKRGRVVLVGVVGLNINRDDMYAKELDFMISCSYGPGRYDSKYEELGLDYPLPYIRWTENRNLTQFLKLCAERKLQIEPLIEKTFSLEEAQMAYQAFNASEKPLAILLQYPEADIKLPTRKIELKDAPVKKMTADKVRIALIGAGAFAKAMHLPILKQLSDKCVIEAICTLNGVDAINLARQYEARVATTDFEEILADKNIEAVLIATRHNLHAEMSLKALQSGKNVFVEKPLALNRIELEKIKNFYSSNSGKNLPVLQTGFNRRFSPFASKLRELVSKRAHPMIITYRVNAGYIPYDHWVHTNEGGGRNIGEACHIYDFLRFIVASEYRALEVKTITPASSYYRKIDNFAVLIEFTDGSLANVVYSSLGNNSHPKEQAEFFFDGNVAVLNNYSVLTFNNKELVRSNSKGHYEELVAFLDGIKSGKYPIPLNEQLEVMQMAFDVEDKLCV